MKHNFRQESKVCIEVLPIEKVSYRNKSPNRRHCTREAETLPTPRGDKRKQSSEDNLTITGV